MDTHPFTVDLRTFYQNPPYMRYMDRFLDPEKLKNEMELPFDLPEKVTEPEWLGILIESSFIFNSSTPIPKAFSRLQLQALLCLQSLNSNAGLQRIVNIKKNLGGLGGEQTITIDFDELNISQTLMEKVDYLCQEVFTRSISFFEKLVFNTKRMKAFIPKQLIGAFFTPIEKRHFFPFEYSKKKTQTGIMAKNLNPRELIRTEKDDQIIRTIAYFKQNKGFLKPSMSLFDGEVFRWFMFKGMLLKKQLEESPMSAEAIGEFLSECLDHFASIDEMRGYILIAHIGIKLKEYCKFHAPNSLHAFPDFSQHIQSFLAGKNESPLTTKLSYLAALAQEPSNLSHAELMQCAKVVCMTKFRHHKLKNYTSFTEISSEFQIHYQKWLPVIRQLMETPEDRKEIIENILRSKGVEKIPQGNWTLNFEGYYELENISVDLEQVKIVIKNDPLASALELVKKILIPSLGSIVNELVLTEPNIYETPNGELKLILKQHADADGRFSAKRIYQGKSYAMTFSFDHLNQTFWLEETSSPQKEALIFKANQLDSILKVEQAEPNSPKLRIIESTKIPENNQPNNQPVEELIPIDPSSLPSLLPLRKFCPTGLSCLKRSGEKHLSQINFTPYDLNFKVTSPNNEPREPRAVCDKFPGYYIAPKQSHHALKGFPAALLLQNDLGQQKVIIPADFWVPSLISRFTSQLGALAKGAALWSNGMQGNDAQSYYVFELKDSSLTNDDPLAMLYLILLYLIQNQFDLAEQASGIFIDLSKQQHLPPMADKMMLFLSLFPSGNIQIRRMRQKMMAACEENRVLQSSLLNKNEKKAGNNRSPKKPELATSPHLTHAVFSAIALMDLTQLEADSDPRNQLREDQEWFLFQSFLHHSKSLAIQNNSGKLKKVTDQIDWDNVVTQLLLPPQLQKRYLELNQKFGKEDSMLSKVVSLGIDTIKAESNIPSFNQIVQGIQSKLGKDISSAILPLGSEKFDFGSNLLSLIQSMTSLFIPKNQLKKKDLIRLQLEMQKNVEEKPPLDYENFSTGTLIKYFLSYYAIAATHHEGPDKKKLKKLLNLVKGGWDPLSSLLIQYLETILNYPLLFSQIRKLEKTFTQSNQFHLKNPEYMEGKIDPKISLKSQYPLFCDFFNSLDSKTKRMKNLYEGMSVVLKGIGNAAISNANGEMISSLLNVSQLTVGSFLQSMRWMDKFRTAWNGSNAAKVDLIKEKPVKNPLSPEPNYQLLEEEDQKFSSFFNNLFQQTFEILPCPPIEEIEKTTLPPLESINSNAKLTEVNQSLADYYSRKDRMAPFIRLKSHDSIWDLYGIMANCTRFHREQLEMEEKAIIEMVNFGSNKLQRPLSFEDLRKFYIKGDLSALKECCNFSHKMIQDLDLAISRYLVKRTRLQQMERILNVLEDISQVSLEKEPQIYAEKVEKLASELKAERAYSFSNLPPRLLKTFLMFEYKNQIMLWSKQVSRMKDLLVDLPADAKDAVIELLMSLGKTFFCGPTISHYEANGSQIVFNVYPSQMFATFSKQGSTQAKKTFNQSTNVLKFQRSSPLKQENLQALLVVLARALKEGESFNATKEDCQSLELMLIDRLYSCEKEKNRQGEEEILGLKTVLSTIRRFGKLSGDEGHDLLNDIDWLNWPIGNAKTLSAPIYLVIDACTKALASDAELLQFIQTDNMEALKNCLNSRGVPLVADQLSLYKRFKINTREQQQEFIHYVTGKTDKVPDVDFEEQTL